MLVPVGMSYYGVILPLETYYVTLREPMLVPIDYCTTSIRHYVFLYLMPRMYRTTYAGDLTQ